MRHRVFSNIRRLGHFSVLSSLRDRSLRPPRGFSPPISQTLCHRSNGKDTFPQVCDGIAPLAQGLRTCLRQASRTPRGGLNYVFTLFTLCAPYSEYNKICFLYILNHTIIWICPSVCPFRNSSAVSRPIATKLGRQVRDGPTQNIRPLVSMATICFKGPGWE